MRSVLLLALGLLATACDSAVEANAPRAGSHDANAGHTTGIPALTGRVVDVANLIPPDREQALAASLEAVEREAGPQFVIVTVPSLGGLEIEDFGVALGRYWGIGDARRHDGVLLIVAPNERMARIEVGYGLEASLRDERAAEIMARDILPRFHENDLVGGIEAGSAAIIARLRASPTLDGT